jgi:glycosyltransferase involved in cell wall biosynthesis
MVSIITISNSKEKLLKTAQGVIRECKNFNSEWEYIIVECQKENSDRNCISETEAKTEADELENEIKKIKEEHENKNQIRHIKVEKCGFSYQRNIGAKKSKHEILVFVDDGMDIPEGWLKKLISPIISGEADAVLGGVLPKLEKGKTKENVLALCQSILGFPGGGLKYYALGTRPIDSFSTPNLAIRKELIEFVGGFDEKLIFGAEDSDLAIRIKSKFPNSKFLYKKEAYVIAEPRKNLKEITRWFIRRGKALATLKIKYSNGKTKIKDLLSRELILPKIFISSSIPLILPVFSISYVAKVEETLFLVKNKLKSTDIIPKEYFLILPLALPIFKFIADVCFSIGFYSIYFSKNVQTIQNFMALSQ